MFQLQNNIKPDYINTGGLQIFNEEEREWEDWYLETENDYYEDVDEYCDQCEKAEELKEFSRHLSEQIDLKTLYM